MVEIEPSSRLYEQDGAAVMTTPLLITQEGHYPETAEVTFVLTDRHLVTVRYAEPSSLATFAKAAERTPALCAGPLEALTGLLDAIVDRLADVLEDTGRELDAIGRETATTAVPSDELRARMQQLSRNGDVVSKARESLVGLSRLTAFLRARTGVKRDPDAMERLDVVARDVEVLLEHAGALAAKVTFLLDTLLGMVNIEQNAIIKTFSVVAVMFLPPTLIASIYGMNYQHMPELDWRLGYPLALAAMVASMIAPYAYFKRKGWI
jgi:magnesium transporter